MSEDKNRLPRLPERRNPGTVPTRSSICSSSYSSIESIGRGHLSRRDEKKQIKNIKRPIAPYVRYYNYEAFMNRSIGDEGDYAVEVLVTKPNWEDNIATELTRRSSANNRRTGRQLSSDPKWFGDGRRLQRVRIRSKTVLGYLSELAGFENMAEDSIVFCRPYRVFEYFHEDMKKKLAELETIVKTGMESQTIPLTEAVPETLPGDEALQSEGDEEQSEGDEEQSEGDEEQSEGDEEHPALKPRPVPQTGLEDMRCFVEFVETKILPLRRQYEKPDKLSHRLIMYEDIPYLFKSGALAFVPPTAGPDKTHHRSAVQRVWRMGTCCPMDHPNKFHDDNFHTDGLKKTSWHVYYLDYNGDKLVPIWREISFTYFKGEKEITDLECFPLAFHPRYETILKDQKESGELFKNCVKQSVQYFYYSGWTFVTGILAETLEDDKGAEIKYPEYIESEVVIDFKETTRNFPKWETESRLSLSTSTWRFKKAEISFRVWREDAETQLPLSPHASSSESILVREDDLYERGRLQYWEEDEFLKENMDLSTYKWTEDDLALMPNRLFGYVLRERKFSRLDVRAIEWENKQNKITLNDIQMNNDHRNIIRSAVSSHFKAQEDEKTLGISPFNLDLVRGKGKGLVILLHGAPGVGKTATAEAVAAENDKPLFPITCGDLGFAPDVVDKSLKDIFRYAHLWECILLLDEADVFLTQRERNSLERNALVGVFLRVLEYYSGILFLTTNRVGALDEAFRSRVHVSLWYPHLSRDDTVNILRSNLQRLPRIDKVKDRPSSQGLLKVMDKDIEDFVAEEYDKYARANKKRRGPWNGRQIRNAVQIAACLALYQKETEIPKDSCPAILTADNFRSVAKTTAEFEKFLKATKVGDESFLARQRQDRADDWSDGGGVDGDDDNGDGEAGYFPYSGYTGYSETEEFTLPHKSGYTAEKRPSAKPGKTRPNGPPAAPTGRLLRRGSSVKNSGVSQSYAISQSYDDGQDDDYDQDTIQEGPSSLRPMRGDPRRKVRQSDYSGKVSSRQQPAEVDGVDDMLDQPSDEEDDDQKWAYSGSRAGMSAPLGQRRQHPRNDGEWKAAPRSDDRVGNGYGGERRYERRRGAA